MKRPVQWSLILIAMLAAASCNTIQGAGKDLEKAGEAVQKAAKKAKKGD